jgi:murein L,D-transpeptidase YafK
VSLLKKNKRLLLWAIVVAGPGFLAVYYFWPVAIIPEGIAIDYIVVHKSRHRLQAFSNGRLIVTYTVAIGKHPGGAKAYEGDQKTPEGRYTISGRNPNSTYHKNLGISYPNDTDRARARRIGKPAGGDIKIHGLKNGHGYIGRFHRWRDWTNGCIALSNAEMDELYKHVQTGAVIEIKK